MPPLESLRLIFTMDPSNTPLIRNYLAQLGIQFADLVLPPEQIPATAAQLLLDHGLITQQQADPWLSSWVKKQAEVQSFWDNRSRDEGRLDLVGKPYPEQARIQEAEYLAAQAQIREQIAQLKALKA